jgi:hypothetical protein
MAISGSGACWIGAGNAVADDLLTREEAREIAEWDGFDEVWDRRERSGFWMEPEPEEPATEQPEKGERVEGWSLPLFARLKGGGDQNAPVLAVDAPMDNAKAFAERCCYRDGKPTAWFWHDGSKEGTTLWRWNGRIYVEVSDGELRAEVGAFLDGSMKWEVQNKIPGLVRFQPKPQHTEADLRPEARAGVEGQRRAADVALDGRTGWRTNGVSQRDRRSAQRRGG